MNKNLDFENMSYVEFISFLRETNRCPGGKDTINWILRNSFATKESQVLEIGSNTGFTSLEIARLLKCHVLGIDIVPEAITTAQQELLQDTPEVQKSVQFKVASAYEIPCKNNSIDLIVSGGATSFMDDKSKAVDEMFRVLKPWGFCSVTNLFYHTEPPKDILDNVSNIIGVRINYMTAEDWIKIYTKNDIFEVYKLEQVKLEAQSQSVIDNYIEYFMSKPHIQALSNEEKNSIRHKWKNILYVFNENHKYLGFIRCLLRKRHISEEPELFKIKSF